jgi:hypothetical protein
MSLPQSLQLERCPHCQVDRPNLAIVWQSLSQDSEGQNFRHWAAYKCARCGGIVTAFALQTAGQGVDRPQGWFPGEKHLDEDIPQRARGYLSQAIASTHAPAGAVMLAGSAVDAMLKKKGYTEGSLYTQIDKAAEEHVITSEMAAWAHDIRLEANKQRHVDEDTPLPSPSDAERAIEFATALAQFIFVLPARVKRGREKAGTRV